MSNRTVVLAVVIAVAIFVGVTITVQRTNDPILRRLVEQQSQILASQQKLENQMRSPQPVAGAQEQKVADLEKKIDALTVALKNLQAPAPAPAPERPAPSPEDFTKVYEIPIDQSTVQGKRDAPITITSFVDLECPFSARFEPVVEEVLAAYPGKVNRIMKQFPLFFHQQARPAAKAVLAAGEQGKYWEMAELILKNNRGLSQEKYEEFAKTLKLNIKKFKADMTERDAAWEAIIQKDMELGMKADVRGTPTYYINGRKTRARDLDSFKQEIDAILGQK